MASRSPVLGIPSTPAATAAMAPPAGRLQRRQPNRASAAARLRMPARESVSSSSKARKAAIGQQRRAIATPSPSLSPMGERNFSAGVNGGRGGAEEGLSVGYAGGTHVRQGAHLGQQRKVAAEHETLRARSIKSSGVDVTVVEQLGGC